MKHHRKTIGKHTQKKNGMRKTMKGGGWSNPFTWFSSTTENTTETTSDNIHVAPVTTIPSKPFSLSEFFGLNKNTDTPPTAMVNNNNNTGTGTGTSTGTGTGGYMGGKRRSKTAKKNCPKKGGGK